MNQESWFEIDLYWFQGGTAADKARELFDRYAPLMNRCSGARKGLVLCAGFNFESVLCWRGELADLIASCNGASYDGWTYARLRELIAALRAEAERRQWSDFHVGLSQLGGVTEAQPAHSNEESRYRHHAGRTDRTGDWWHYDIAGRWFPHHTEVVDPRFPGRLFFDAPVILDAAERSEWGQTPPLFGEYYAVKLAAMSRAVGLDAVVLRDSVFCPAYFRGGATRYLDPALRSVWNRSLLGLLRRIKNARPELLTVGYSSGTSAMEEWRSHGFDLEQVAGAGDLDLFITQTWASAWQDYWPDAGMGYTFQLASVLVHAAMLAKTRCRHLFVIETFDAWEPFDAVHEFPDKLKWEIWAYSHAAVHRGDRTLTRPAGHYLSWLNKGDQLLPASTVDFLQGTLDDAAADLAAAPAPLGPALVFDRPSWQDCMARPADYCRGESVDDWVALLTKYGTPCLGVVRREDLDKVATDGLIWAAPATVTEPEAFRLQAQAAAGKPLLLLGLACDWSPDLRRTFAIPVTDGPVLAALPTPATVEIDDWAARIGTRGLVINQRCQSLRAGETWETLITCLGGPVLARHRSLPVLVWETPEWGTPRQLSLTIASIQSPQTYHAVALAFGSGGWGREQVRWQLANPVLAGAFHGWRYPDGRIGLLFGNVETGLTGCSMFPWRGRLDSRRNEISLTRHAGFAYGRLEEPGPAGVTVALPGHKSTLFGGSVA